MILKWHKNILKFKKKKISFNSDIIYAEEFREWVIVATSNKLNFIGINDVVLSIPILNIHINKGVIYYQNREDMKIYKLTHPYEMEEYLFYSPFYTLKYAFGKEMFILENNGEILILNNHKVYNIQIENKEVYLKETNLSILHKCIDNKLNMHKCKENKPNIHKWNLGKLQVMIYEEYIVIINGRYITFIKNINENLLIDNTYELNQEIVTGQEDVDLRIIKEQINKKITFLQVNDTIFYKNEYFVKLKKYKEKNKVHKQNYYKPFWNNIDFINKKLFTILNIKETLNLIRNKLNEGEYLYETNILSNDKIDDLLEGEYVKCRTYDGFLKKIGNQSGTNKMEFDDRVTTQGKYKYADIKYKEYNRPDKKINKLNHIGQELEISKLFEKHDFVKNDSESVVTSDLILKYSKFMNNFSKVKPESHELMNCRDFFSLLNINYTRIFFYNENIIKEKSVIQNLAYKIIYLEKNRNIKKLGAFNFFNFYKKLFKDERLLEIFNLFDEKIQVFELDENDIEDKKEKNYILRLSTNIGKSMCLYNVSEYLSSKNKLYLEENPERIKVCELLNSQITNLKEEIIYPINKNNEVKSIDLKDNLWKNMPNFNYGCLKILMTKKIIKIQNILDLNITDNFLLSGMIYGMGLKKYFLKEDFSSLLKLLPKDDYVLMTLLVSYGVSNQNVRNADFEKHCFSIINKESTLYTKVGALTGISYIFQNTKNLKIKNILINEINKKGLFKYSRSNMIWYDKIYKVTNSFNLARILLSTDEYIELDNKLCELLVNGICNKNIRKNIRRLRRFKGDPLDEIFYSGMFLEELYEYNSELYNNLNTQNKVFDNVEDNWIPCEGKGMSSINKSKNILLDMDEYNSSGRVSDINLKKLEGRLFEIERNYSSFSIWDIYKCAGIIFYYGINFTFEVKESYISLLLKIEKEISKNMHIRILFDYMLITFCLFSQAKFDINLIRIIRRQIKKSVNPIDSTTNSNYVFTTRGLVKETYNMFTYGDMEMYKICLGLCTLGLSNYTIQKNRNLKIDLISTFYINWPTSPYEEKYFTYFRYGISKYLVEGDMLELRKYINTRKIRKMFKENSIYDHVDRKYFIDVLSDYYEKYHRQSDYIIDIEYFKRLVIRYE